MVASHSPQLRVTDEGQFWKIPQTVLAHCSPCPCGPPLGHWDSSRVGDTRLHVSSGKRAPGHIRALEAKALRFSLYGSSASTGLDDAPL